MLDLPAIKGESLVAFGFFCRQVRHLVNLGTLSKIPSEMFGGWSMMFILHKGLGPSCHETRTFWSSRKVAKELRRNISTLSENESCILRWHKMAISTTGERFGNDPSPPTMAARTDQVTNPLCRWGQQCPLLKGAAPDHPYRGVLEMILTWDCSRTYCQCSVLFLRQLPTCSIPNEHQVGLGRNRGPVVLIFLVTVFRWI